MEVPGNLLGMLPAVAANIYYQVCVKVWHRNTMEAPAYKRETEGCVIDLAVFAIPMANDWRCFANYFIQKLIRKFQNEGFVHIEYIIS